MLVGGVMNTDEVGREGEEVGGIRGGHGLNFRVIPKLEPSLQKWFFLMEMQWSGHLEAISMSA